jgi:hypothetical protein
MTENKQAICNSLTDTLNLTRCHSDLMALTYRPDEEIVVAHYENGAVKEINVACDSGIAMIVDIIRGLN